MKIFIILFTKFQYRWFKILLVWDKLILNICLSFFMKKHWEKLYRVSVSRSFTVSWGLYTHDRSGRGEARDKLFLITETFLELAPRWPSVFPTCKNEGSLWGQLRREIFAQMPYNYITKASANVIGYIPHHYSPPWPRKSKPNHPLWSTVHLKAQWGTNTS